MQQFYFLYTRINLETILYLKKGKPALYYDAYKQCGQVIPKSMKSNACMSMSFLHCQSAKKMMIEGHFLAKRNSFEIDRLFSCHSKMKISNLNDNLKPFRTRKLQNDINNARVGNKTSSRSEKYSDFTSKAH